MRSDIIRVYKDAHSWVGIISGLCLFIAFYAGAITIFEQPLKHWASPPLTENKITPLEQVPALLSMVFQQHPEAESRYQVVLNPGPSQPGRVNWQVVPPDAHDHALPVIYHANLNSSGMLEITKEEPSQVAQLIDTLHQQIGLPFEHEVAMPITGIIALLYVVALISGLIVLLPTLIKDLFALRIGKNLKRMWLDFHNLLGMFSLPFHLIMALTAVAFSFHDEFYALQNKLIYPQGQPPVLVDERAPIAIRQEGDEVMPPSELIQHLAEQAPEYTPLTLDYGLGFTGHFELRVAGTVPRQVTPMPNFGNVLMNPYTGDILSTDYMPGRQNNWSTTVGSFFSLHFGNFGGLLVRWSYFILGLAGALLFYTGNILWVESHSKRRAKISGAAGQPKSPRVLAALTVGVCLGTVAGISILIATAKLAPQWATSSMPWGYNGLYYTIFCTFILIAFIQGAAKASYTLLLLAAISTTAIPLASLLSLIIPGLGWNHVDGSIAVDLCAAVGASLLMALARKTQLRARQEPKASVWYKSPLKNRWQWS